MPIECWRRHHSMTSLSCNLLSVATLFHLLIFSLVSLSASQELPNTDVLRAQTRVEQQENLHKPKFATCDNYKPYVQEEAPTDTRVLQVYAEDVDAGPNGAVTYSIVSRHEKFKVDPKTGWLTTNVVFNRDEPDREKVVFVTVKASDNGRPQLEDVCTLEVRIGDINDNAPVFDKSVYSVPIPLDTPVGTRIMSISASDVDEGDNQRIEYELRPATSGSEGELEYFRWHWQTGFITLNRRIDKPVGHNFIFKAMASDMGTPARSSTADVSIEVKESSNKPPTFVDGPGEIKLSEVFSEFSRPVATYEARSNIPGDDNVFFQLLQGRTEQTNKAVTFRSVQRPEQPQFCDIYLAKPLEYEKVNRYTLTLQVRNSPDLVAEALLTVIVLDENNQAPVFINVESGSVLENEPPDTIVMQVQAIDNDGTSPNNDVKYQISEQNPSDVRQMFAIDPKSGLITTRVQFDREKQSVYALTIDAYDAKESALLNNGFPNITPQKFRIVIADKNDNAPYFPQIEYKAEIPEDVDVSSKVIEVRASDKDTEASLTTYQIVKGNVGNAFKIDETTGMIKVAKALDYEAIKEYNLVIGAWDGQFSSQTEVHIAVKNVNDMKPQFKQDRYVVRQREETVPDYPIATVSAIDPDIEDPNAEQHILYYLDPQSQLASHFDIDSRTGEVRIVKKLDRDPPNGFSTWTTFIYAKDQSGGPKGIESYVEFVVKLDDINDNAPFLDMDNGLVWTENQPGGDVGPLHASDYDTEENGPPFVFGIDTKASDDIKAKFAIKGVANGSYVLQTLVSFDREAQKEYSIPISICDNQQLCATSHLRLVIGDVNDNKMKPGFSDIFVYRLEDSKGDTDIGRVYVDDPDDWDINDKRFFFQNPSQVRGFILDRDSGMITMKDSLRMENELQQSFVLKFTVEDQFQGQVGDLAIDATVNVTVALIPLEAVHKSGSVRLRATPEAFVTPDDNGVTKRDRFTALLKQWLNVSIVDVFTVLPINENDKETMVDVRFAAHGSPYLYPERLEGVLGRRLEVLERNLALDVVMVHVDECLKEKFNCDYSCYNDLQINKELYAVYTNKSSFVGVEARVLPVCGCNAPLKHLSCSANPCRNEGVCTDTLDSFECDCGSNSDFYGPKCEKLAVSFNSQGWSLQPGVQACDKSVITLTFKTGLSQGLVFYVGPTLYNVVEELTDFVALEIDNGRLNLKINFGSGTFDLTLEQRVDDNREHFVVLSWTNSSVQMELDQNTCTNLLEQSSNQCFKQISIVSSKNRYVNTNGPMHVGGVQFGEKGFDQLAQALDIKRSDLPLGRGFGGCMRNLTLITDGQKHFYDLGSPSEGENFTPGCDDEFVQAVTALGINTSFLIALLLCLIALLTLVLLLAVYRKKRHVYTNDKDIDCDIRENIINYDDEGGGENDQTTYDLSVLRMINDNNNGDKLYSKHLEHPPDIQGFLLNSKERVDDDPDTQPFDDLRHYAYEGDANSIGSLSSLNSSEDEDLEFDYLHNFGPRFKKLADMYGEEPDSDEEENVDHDGNSIFDDYGGGYSNSTYNNDERRQQSKGFSAMPPSESWC